MLAVSTAFAEINFNNFQVITSSCPDHMNGIDLVWAMDASASVGLKRYQSGIDFMKWATLAFTGHIGDGPDESRMAFFEFDETQYSMFELDTFNTAKGISDYINTLRNKDQNGTDNFFVQAIDFARANLFNKARAGNQKVLVFVADGWTDENLDDITAASKRATDDKIDVWFIGYESDFSKKVSNAVVGGNQDRVSFESVFSDVSKFGGCANPPSPTVHPEHCVHGEPYCYDCPAPFYGPHCDLKYTCDNKPPAVINDLLTRPHLCHDHGVCNDTYLGPKCTCNKCWTGEWCGDYNTKECLPTNRCILYDTDYTRNNKTAEQNMCDMVTERCVPDNVDCALNVHTTMVNGRPQCVTPDPKQKCKCEYPIGYCLPLPASESIFKSLAFHGDYVDKFFTGSS